VPAARELRLNRVLGSSLPANNTKDTPYGDTPRLRLLRYRGAIQAGVGVRRQVSQVRRALVAGIIIGG
jgi:hypothetical protein